MRDRDRILGRRSRRVDDPDEREQREPVEEREQVGARIERRRVEILASRREHPQALLSEARVLRLVAPAHRIVDLRPDAGRPG